MDWFTLKIDSWDRYTSIVDAIMLLGPPIETYYLFRGQAKAEWGLQPSIMRELGDVPLERYFFVENAALMAFKGEACSHISPTFLKNDNMLSWWTLMQHYRAPTRLLDWTASPYVAMYFAVQDKGYWDQDGAIWSFQPYRLTLSMNEKFPDYAHENPRESVYELPEPWLKNPATPPKLFSFQRQPNTDRMVAQQGQFSVCLQPNVDHAAGIDEALHPQGGNAYLKLVVSKTLKREFLHRLRAMNIAANSLFPGIDGVGLSVAEMVRLSDVRNFQQKLPHDVKLTLADDSLRRKSPVP